jgi:hypothetical protein
MLNISEKKRLSYDFLCKLYQKSDGDNLDVIEGRVIFDELGITKKKDRNDIISYLSSHHYINLESMFQDYSCSLTLSGGYHAKNGVPF